MIEKRTEKDVAKKEKVERGREREIDKLIERKDKNEQRDRQKERKGNSLRKRAREILCQQVHYH